MGRFVTVGACEVDGAWDWVGDWDGSDDGKSDGMAVGADVGRFVFCCCWPKAPGSASSAAASSNTEKPRHMAQTRRGFVSFPFSLLLTKGRDASFSLLCTRTCWIAPSTPRVL